MDGNLFLPIPDPLGIIEKLTDGAAKDPLLTSMRETGLLSPPNPWPSQTAKSDKAKVSCEYGIECIKNHFLKAKLYLDESIRFSSGGAITPEARGKVQLARKELLCEDDFQEALRMGDPLKYEVLKLLASTRSTWKAIESSGVDLSSGSVDDLIAIKDNIDQLVKKAYAIDAEYRKQKKAPSFYSEMKGLESLSKEVK